MSSLGADRLDELRMHPTVKPVSLVADAIKDCSKNRGIILDPFVGSGTTIIAAEKTGRRATTMDLDPKYVQTAIRRWETFTGKEAVHLASGVSFRDLPESRTRGAESTNGKSDPSSLCSGAQEAHDGE